MTKIEEIIYTNSGDDELEIKIEIPIL